MAGLQWTGHSVVEFLPFVREGSNVSDSSKELGHPRLRWNALVVVLGSLFTQLLAHFQNEWGYLYAGGGLGICSGGVTASAPTSGGVRLSPGGLWEHVFPSLGNAATIALSGVRLPA